MNNIKKEDIDMVKLKALETFSLGRFDELKNVERANERNDLKGKLYKDDTFECELELAKYMLNETTNPVNRAVAEIIEVKPVKVKEEKAEEIKEPIKPARKPRIKKIK